MNFLNCLLFELRDVFQSKRKRAFIAAPLIGTIIFVTAIVFIVNIDRSESNSINQISQEAYHNRVNSIVELYRSDAGSLFKEDIKTVVEQALTRECWTSLFGIRVKNAPSDGTSQKIANLQQAKYTQCQVTRDTLNAVICSHTGDPSDAACVNACSTSRGADYTRCIASCGGTRSYGLQRFLQNINQEFNFEGITLLPSNVQKFNDFFNPQTNGAADTTQYVTNCRNLIKGVTMDCAAFSRGQLQCCKRSTNSPTDVCEPNNVIPGCEQGTFFVSMSPSDPGVFENLPRIQAKDDAGNYLRGGALGDADELLLPINFPLMKYFNASFNIYQHLAYGPRIGENDGNEEGILDGICQAGATCTDQTHASRIAFDPGFTWSTGDLRKSNSRDAIAQLGETFYRDNFLRALSDLPENIEINITTPSIGTCRNVHGTVSCDAGAEQAITQLAKSASVYVPISNAAGTSTYYSAYLPVMQIDEMKLIDKDPSFRVSPDKDNEFCTAAFLNYKYS